MGHDVAFCLRARQLGWKSFVDTSLRCGHLSEVEVTWKDNERAFNELQAQLEAGELPECKWETRDWKTRLSDMAAVPGAKVDEYTEGAAMEHSTRVLTPINPYNILRAS